MKLNELAPNVLDNIESGISTHLESSPGRGKSEFVHDLIAELSARDGFQWGLAECFLATMTPSDLIGYLIPSKSETGELISTFTVPPWMVTRPSLQHPRGVNINTFKRGIVFLDEFGQADGDTKKAAAQLMLKGQIGPHQLHSGISVIAASNLKGDRSGVTKDFDFLINRQCKIQISDDIDAWLEWALSHNVSTTAMAFAKQNPTVVFTEGVPKEQGPWMTPRSLVMADNVLKQKAKRNNGVMPDDPSTIEQIRGIVGPAAAMSLFNFVKLAREMPSYEDIVKDPAKCRLPTKPDAQMLVCYDLAQRIQIKDATEVVEYVQRMPKEFAVVFAMAAVKKQVQLVTTPAIIKWSRENSSLMAAISKSPGAK